MTIVRKIQIAIVALGLVATSHPAAARTVAIKSPAAMGSATGAQKKTCDTFMKAPPRLPTREENL